LTHNGAQFDKSHGRVGPRGRLERETASIERHRRELEEVTAQYQLDAPEWPRRTAAGFAADGI
jgi:hypothetical protein